jgi:hypothetical protein
MSGAQADSSVSMLTLINAVKYRESKFFTSMNMHCTARGNEAKLTSCILQYAPSENE